MVCQTRLWIWLQNCDSSQPSFFLLRMILEESANENVRSVINNVGMTARRRGLPDPLSICRPRKEMSLGELVLCLMPSCIILVTSLHLSVHIIQVSRPISNVCPFFCRCIYHHCLPRNSVLKLIDPLHTWFYERISFPWCFPSGSSAISRVQLNYYSLSSVLSESPF